MVLHDLPAVSAQELQKLRRRPLPAQREPGTAHQPEAQPCKPALPRMRKRRYDEQAARCEHARSLIERLVWLRQQVKHIGGDDDLEAAVGIGQIAHVLNRKVQLAGVGMASCHVDHPGRGIRRLDRGRLVHDPVRDHARPCCQLQHGAVADGRTDPLEHLRIGLLIRAHEVRIPPRIAVPEALFLHASPLFRLVVSN